MENWASAVRLTAFFLHFFMKSSFFEKLWTFLQILSNRVKEYQMETFPQIFFLNLTLNQCISNEIDIIFQVRKFFVECVKSLLHFKINF